MARRWSATRTRIVAFDREQRERSTSRSPRSAAASCSTACSSAIRARRWAGSGTSSELPEMPHAGHLTQVLAQHEFQEAFKNYRDLRFLTQNLQRVARHAGVSRATCWRTAAQAYAERLPQGARQRRRRSTSTALTKRRDAAGRRARAGGAEADGAAFADAERRAPARRGWPTLRAIARSDGQRSRGRRGAPSALRRVAGALHVAARAGVPRCVCGRRRRRCATHRRRARTRRGAATRALAQAQRDEPARFEAFAARIAALAKRTRRADPARGGADATSSRVRCKSSPWPS